MEGHAEIALLLLQYNANVEAFAGVRLMIDIAVIIDTVYNRVVIFSCLVTG